MTVLSFLDSLLPAPLAATAHREATLRVNSAARFMLRHRTILLALVGLGILSLTSVALFRGDHPALPSLLCLGLAWTIATILTFVLAHAWAQDSSGLSSEDDFAPFVRHDLSDLATQYFILDTCLLLFIAFASVGLELQLESTSLLLVSSTVGFFAYILDTRYLRVASVGAIVTLLCLLSLATRHQLSQRFGPSPWWSMALSLGVLLVSLVSAVSFVFGLSFLRSREHTALTQQLSLLGLLEQTLSGNTDSAHDPKNAQGFRKRLMNALKILCTQDRSFWYVRAAVWVRQDHQDHGHVLVPLSWFWPQQDTRPHPVYPREDYILWSDRALFVPSLHALPTTSFLHNTTISRDVDSKLAAFPLLRHGQHAGTLLVEGDAQAAFLSGDPSFFTSLSALISGTMEQWAQRERRTAEERLESLLTLTSRDQVLASAVRLLTTHLHAEACMIALLDQQELTIVAADGCDPAAVGATYPPAPSMTREVLRSGKQRIDDVQAHRDRFPDDLFLRLEEWLGTPVHSWMGVPIGSPPNSIGVVKVLNHIGLTSWFTSEDEALAAQLANRLLILIEKLGSIDELRAAREVAENSAARAQDARKEAERLAEERRDILLTMTHQVQAPLNAIVTGLTTLRRGVFGSLPQRIEQRIRRLRAFADDALLLSQSTTSGLTLDAGGELLLVPEEVDVQQEASRIADNLRVAHSRTDLRFSFHKDARFPAITCSKAVLCSILYSLIHNAVKYSDPGRVVEIHCGLERDTPAIKVKSHGEPIDYREREAILKDFGAAGRSNARGATTKGWALACRLRAS